MPHGATGELIPALEGLRRARQPTKVVLGLRDILDAPEVIRRQWLAEGALDAVERYYDRILVYGIRDLFDLAEAYGLPPAVSARVRYCGYVCTSAKARYTARIRAEYTAGSKQAQKLLVAMAGGGADAYPAMRALVDAVPHLQRKLQFRLVLITGPFIPPEHRRDLQARAAGLPVKVRISVSDSLSYIDAADLVVAMAGYNTTTEILRSGTPAVLIPRAGPSAEQRMRVRLFLARGWVHAIDPDAATGPRVARTILKALRPQPPKDGQPGPDLGGLTAVVDELLALHSEGSSGRRSVAGARV
jgi:predicted glycosyltransferase